MFFKKKENKNSKWNTPSKEMPKATQLILGKGVYSDITENGIMCPNNTLVIGASASGKGRDYILPNLLSGDTNYIVVDLNGVIHKQYGNLLKSAGFEIKCVDITGESDDCVNFNPFAYVKSDEDVACMAEILAEDWERRYKGGDGDPFFIALAKKVCCTLLCYVRDRIPKHEQSLVSLYRDVFENKICADSHGGSKQTMIENYHTMMKEYCEEFPDGYGEKCYKEICEPAIEASLGTTFMALAAATMPLFRAIYRKSESFAAHDGVDLSSFKDRKQILFLHPHSSVHTYDVYYELCIAQAYRSLISDENRGERAVHFVLDEFSRFNIAKIENFLAVGQRSRIFTSLVIQSIEQLRKKLDVVSYDACIAKCTNIVYMSGPCDTQTAEFVSAQLGETVVDGQSHKKYKFDYFEPRGLLSVEDVYRLPIMDCIVLRYGKKPYLTEKFDLTSLPNYKEQK